jgi:hypothetical protein
MSTAKRHSAGRLKSLAVGLLVLLLTAGCSSAIAATQYMEKTTLSTKFDVGATRKVAERELGRSDTTEAYADGTMVATYRYTLRYTPAGTFWSDPGERAFLWLNLDRLFLLPEIVLVPLEIGGKIYRIAKSQEHSLIVVYGHDDRVAWIGAEPTPRTTPR